MSRPISVEDGGEVLLFTMRKALHPVAATGSILGRDQMKVMSMSATDVFSIGVLSQRSSVNVETFRYYERAGPSAETDPQLWRLPALSVE